MATVLVDHFADYKETNFTVLLKSFHRYERSDTMGFKTADSKLSEVFGIIKGDVARIPSSEFYANCGKDPYIYNGNIVKSRFKYPFPVCVRYQSKSCVVVERPPFKVSVRVNYRKSSSRRKQKALDKSSNFLEIWIPWTILIMDFSNNGVESNVPSNFNVSLFFRSSALTSFDDYLSLPYTPNIFNDGRICLGQTQSEFHQSVNSGNIDMSDISTVYQYIINQYFSGGWNLDLGMAGLNYYSFSRIFTNDYMIFVSQKATEKNNRFLISLFKKFDKQEIMKNKNISERFRMNFVYNFLSCLSLDETLNFLDKIKELYVENLNDNDRYNRMHTTTFKSVLSRLDSSFVLNYDLDGKNIINDEDLRLLLLERENDFALNHFQAASSSQNNSLALHQWKIKILFDIEDFLNFASNQMLGGYCNTSWRHLNRANFYKKNIASNIIIEENQYYLHRLSNEYFDLILSKLLNSDSRIKDAVLELSSYYSKYEVGQDSYQREIVLDFSDQILVQKEVSVL